MGLKLRIYTNFNVNLVRKHEFLVFAFFFSVLLAFMVGLTIGVLGVLVRFKAPLLFLLVLTVDMPFDKVEDVN